MSSAVRQLNQNASVIDSKYALHMNISAAKGLCDVLKTNLGPKGTIKMLVNGAGDVRLTKDGCELLNNMSIQNPTASMIARSATAQDDVTGDGTTTICLTIGEILKHAERSISEGVHPRVIADGLEAAKHEALKFLSGFKIVKEKPDRETLLQVARSSLCTKLTADLADNLAEIVVRSVQTIEKEDGSIDLFMVEILHMLHRFDMETRFVEGIVLDHGYRHSEMPKVQKDVHILTMNCSLEYEKSEVNSSFMYKNAYDREKLVAAERKHTDDRVKKIVDFKHKVCGDSGKGFLIVNHKGIDPLSLDMLNSAGIVAVRRAKRRNLERVTLACGGQAVNSLDALSEELLGHADSVVEETLGEEKYVFIEGVANPRSCSILVKGPNAHTIAQIKAAVRDGIRAVRNTMVDKCVVPGAGAFEVSCANHLLTKFMPTVSGRARLGVEAFAKGLLVVPKALCENAGHDAQDSIIKMTEEVEQGNVVGVDLATGEPVDAIALGVLDNVRVKAQCINSSAVIATQLVLVDSILKAGRPMKKDKQ